MSLPDPTSPRAVRRPGRAAATAVTALAALAALPAAAQAGDGGFAPGDDIPLPAPRSLAAADFDNDGHTDLAVVIGGSVPGVQIRKHTVNGDMPPGNTIEAGTQPDQLAVADFDRDGNADLAVTDSAASIVRLRLGKGDATFTAGPTVDVGAGYRPTGLAVGDFDGDARDDLAIAATSATGAALIRVALGMGDGSFDAQRVLGARAAALVAGNLRSDADPDTFEDLVLATGTTTDARSLLATGGGAFEPGTDFGLGGKAPGPRSLALADVEADGRPDLVAATDGGASVRPGRGDGSFGPPVPIALGTGAAPLAVAAGDFDADGHEDVAVGDDGGLVRVRLGDGAGGFRAAPDVRVGGAPSDLVVGDFDGDGTDDLATAGTAANRVSVRFGTGPDALDDNLLVNGGFEGPTPGGRPRTPGIVEWELGGGATWLRYGAPSHAFSPSAAAAPRFATGGARMLWGGASAATGGVTTATQTADVTPSAVGIDHGWATMRFSAYLGGTLAYEDAMSARAEFLDAGGALLGNADLPPVTPADRHNVTTLLRREARQVVPAGTRTIRVTFTSVDPDQSSSSALADNAELNVRVIP
ncbi:MAG TPA: VCBS repeat-containing protein, partial [Solirubrobacteraceae bacterium]|nr:VCBS repeat-containing protein [Solirubrobacteraceae bacterium]